jgi:hypothetical protein
MTFQRWQDPAVRFEAQMDDLEDILAMALWRLANGTWRHT